MEIFARKLRTELDRICIDYHYCKQMDVIKKVKEKHVKIQEVFQLFLQGNFFEISDEEYGYLSEYVLQILKDYSEALLNQDMVLMIDTLEWGFRELLNILIGTDEGEETHE